METMEQNKRRVRREFTEEYKADIVARCNTGDRSIKQVARDFDPTESSVRSATRRAVAARASSRRLRRARPGVRPRRGPSRLRGPTSSLRVRYRRPSPGPLLVLAVRAATTMAGRLAPGWTVSQRRRSPNPQSSRKSRQSPVRRPTFIELGPRNSKLPSVTGIAHWNDDPSPFVWCKSAEEILNALAACCQRISNSDQ